MQIVCNQHISEPIVKGRKHILPLRCVTLRFSVLYGALNFVFFFHNIFLFITQQKTKHTLSFPPSLSLSHAQREAMLFKCNSKHKGGASCIRRFFEFSEGRRNLGTTYCGKHATNAFLCVCMCVCVILPVKICFRFSFPRVGQGVSVNGLW